MQASIGAIKFGSLGAASSLALDVRASSHNLDLELEVKYSPHIIAEYCTCRIQSLATQLPIEESYLVCKHDLLTCAELQGAHIHYGHGTAACDSFPDGVIFTPAFFRLLLSSEACLIHPSHTSMCMQRERPPRLCQRSSESRASLSVQIECSRHLSGQKMLAKHLNFLSPELIDEAEDGRKQKSKSDPDTM